MSKIQELKDKRKDAISRAYTVKSKTARAKQFEIIRTLTLDLNEALYEGIKPFLGIRHTATIIMDGNEVLAESEFGIIEIHAVNDVLSKSWYASTCCVEFKKGDTVTFEIMNLHVTDGQAQWQAGNIEGGHPDDKKYRELCKRDDLAFFKKPDGKMTGLFK